MYTRQG